MYDAIMLVLKIFRAIDMLLEEDLNVYLVSFPDGEDPDLLLIRFLQLNLQII